MQKVIINLYFVIKIGEEVQLKLGDSEAMPWEDESFDVILCNASFHHYPNRKTALSEMKRLVLNHITVRKLIIKLLL